MWKSSDLSTRFCSQIDFQASHLLPNYPACETLMNGQMGENGFRADDWRPRLLVCGRFNRASLCFWRSRTIRLAFPKLPPYFLLKEPPPCYRLMNKSHNIRINLCCKFSPPLTLLIDLGEEWRGGLIFKVMDGLCLPSHAPARRSL